MKLRKIINLLLTLVLGLATCQALTAQVKHRKKAKAKAAKHQKAKAVTARPMNLYLHFT